MNKTAIASFIRIGLFGALALVVLLAVNACGGQTPLKVSPETLTVTAGDGPTTFTASGTSGTVSWSLSPELGTISAASGASTQYTPPVGVQSAQTVTLTASSGGRSASATITVEPHVANVSGVILDSWGKPQANLRVLIPGHPLATSGADGAFAVSNVVFPYQVIVEKSSHNFTVYQGVNREDPVVYVGGSLFSDNYHAVISGSISGSGASGRVVGVDYESPDALGSKSYDTDGSGTTSFNLSLALATDTASGALHALEWTEDANGNAATFTAYGKSDPFPVAAGGTFAGKDFSLTPLAAPSGHEMTVTVAHPSGMTISDVAVGVRFSQDSANEILTAQFSDPSTSTFTIISPNINGARVSAAAILKDGDGNYSGGAWFTVPASSQALALAFPAPPALSAPADGAGGIGVGSSFSWTSNVNPAPVYWFTVKNPPFQFSAVTTAESYQLPDLSAFGESYSGSYEWQVVALQIGSNPTSIDDLLSSGSFSYLAKFIAGGFFAFPANESGYWIVSPSRSFSSP